LTEPKTKKTQAKPQKRNFRWLWVTLVLFIAVLAVIFISQRSQFITPSIPEGTSAAIVDQLYSNYPNEDFTSNITEDLEDFGFSVDVYQGDDVTVDLYRNLPAYDYALIIFRVHSGAISPNPEGDVAPTTGTYLFTNEPFNRMKYTRELLGDELAAAYVLKIHHPQHEGKL